MSVKEIDGVIKVIDTDILYGVGDLLHDLLANEINHAEPDWTGEIVKWSFDIPSIEISFTATIGVGEEED